MSCSHNRSSCGCNGRESRNLLRSCGCDSARRACAHHPGGRIARAEAHACRKHCGSCGHGSNSGCSGCDGCDPCTPCGGECCCKQYPFYTGPCPPACTCRPGVCLPWQECPACGKNCSCAQVTEERKDACECAEMCADDDCADCRTGCSCDD